MTDQENIKKKYFDYISKMLNKREYENQYLLFKDLWNKNKLREAYLLIEGLSENGKLTEEYRKVDEDFYWMFIQ